jgi:hypothetical protein
VPVERRGQEARRGDENVGTLRAASCTFMVFLLVNIVRLHRSILRVALQRRQGRSSPRRRATWPDLTALAGVGRSSTAPLPCHPEWQAGQAEIAAGGGAGRRPAKIADAPNINHAKRTTRPGRSSPPEGTMQGARWVMWTGGVQRLGVWSRPDR